MPLIAKKTRKFKKKVSSPKILRQLEKLINRWEDAKNTDTLFFLSNPKRAIIANIMIGLARGIGFVFGVSFIGVLLITVIGSVLSHFVSIPIIGEFIGLIVKQVQDYLGNK